MEEEKETALDKTTDVAVTVISNIVKVKLASIPIIGGYLVMAFDEVMSSFKEKRIQELFDNLKEQTKRLELEKVNHEYFKSENFTDLIRETTIKASRTKSHEKIKHYSASITERIKLSNEPEPIQDYEHERTITLNNLIDSITYFDIEVLSALYITNLAQYKEEPDNGILLSFNIKLAEPIPGFDRDKTLISIDHLISHGLIYEDNGTYDPTPRGRIGLTYLGKDLVKFINKVAENF